MADVSGRAGVPTPGSDARGLGQDVVAAIGDLAQLLDGFIEATAFGGVPHRDAVEGAVEQLIGAAYTPQRIEYNFYLARVECVRLCGRVRG
jgi:hypothetical protein